MCLPILTAKSFHYLVEGKYSKYAKIKRTKVLGKVEFLKCLS